MGMQIELASRIIASKQNINYERILIPYIEHRSYVVCVSYIIIMQYMYRILFMNPIIDLDGNSIVILMTTAADTMYQFIFM